MDKIVVTIHSENAVGKSDVYIEECDNMITVASMLIKYRPKRGYKMVRFSVDILEVLV